MIRKHSGGIVRWAQAVFGVWGLVSEVKLLGKTNVVKSPERSKEFVRRSNVPAKPASPRLAGRAPNNLEKQGDIAATIGNRIGDLEHSCPCAKDSPIQQLVEI